MSKNKNELLNTEGMIAETPKRRGRPRKAMMVEEEKVQTPMEPAEPVADEYDADDSVIKKDQRYHAKIEVAGKLTPKKAKNLTFGDGEVEFCADRSTILAMSQYYVTQQKARIQIENRLRAIRQGKDLALSDGAINALEFALGQARITEASNVEILTAFADSDPVYRYVCQINGIGPRLACQLLSRIDPERAKHHSSLMQYCGYNTQNSPRYNDKAVQAILNKVLGDRRTITDDDLIQISAMTGRRFEFLDKGCRPVDPKTKQLGNRTRTKLASTLKIPYYNVELRKVMFLITEQFVKRSGSDKSLYGKIYRGSKIGYTEKNESGAFAERAAYELATKNITNAEARATLMSGRLQPIHIERMARRKAGSVFLYHVWCAIQLNAHPGEKLERPYAIEYAGHVDYYEPEVPFEDFFECPPDGIYRDIPVKADELYKKRNIFGTFGYVDDDDSAE